MICFNAFSIDILLLRLWIMHNISKFYMNSESIITFMWHRKRLTIKNLKVNIQNTNDIIVERIGQIFHRTIIVNRNKHCNKPILMRKYSSGILLNSPSNGMFNIDLVFGRRSNCGSNAVLNEAKIENIFRNTTACYDFINNAKFAEMGWVNMPFHNCHEFSASTANVYLWLKIA